MTRGRRETHYNVKSNNLDEPPKISIAFIRNQFFLYLNINQYTATE